MAKIVYNACYGGFSLSEAGVRRYAGIKGLPLFPEKSPISGYLTTWWTVPPDEREGKVLRDDAWHTASMEDRVASNAYHTANTLNDRDIPRSDAALVQVVEELGDEANGMCAKLRIAEVEAGQRFRIDEYDGFESVQTIDSYEWDVAT